MQEFMRRRFDSTIDGCLVVVQLKKPGVPACSAFHENLTHYQQQIPALFWLDALLIASNGTDRRSNGSRRTAFG